MTTYQVTNRAPLDHLQQIANYWWKVSDGKESGPAVWWPDFTVAPEVALVALPPCLEALFQPDLAQNSTDSGVWEITISNHVLQIAFYIGTNPQTVESGL